MINRILRYEKFVLPIVEEAMHHVKPAFPVNLEPFHYLSDGELVIGIIDTMDDGREVIRRVIPFNLAESIAVDSPKIFEVAWHELLQQSRVPF